MKLLLVLFFATICVYSYAQTYVMVMDSVTKSNLELPSSLPDTLLSFSMQSGARMEYWGQKGIASKPLVDTLTEELNVCDHQRALERQKAINFQAYSEEYRQKLVNMTVMYNDKSTDYTKLKVTSDMWEKKAKNRGQTIWIGGGALAIIISGIIIASL